MARKLEQVARERATASLTYVRSTRSSDEDLVARRRLGQTDLKVRAAQLGTSNATKSKNLGMFDYAHLKAPLPRDMLNPELFGNTTPDFYFLMVGALQPSTRWLSGACD